MKKRAVGGINAEQYAYTEVAARESTYPLVSQSYAPERMEVMHSSIKRTPERFIYPSVSQSYALENGGYTPGTNRTPSIIKKVRNIIIPNLLLNLLCF